MKRVLEAGPPRRPYVRGRHTSPTSRLLGAPPDRPPAPRSPAAARARCAAGGTARGGRRSEVGGRKRVRPMDGNVLPLGVFSVMTSYDDLINKT